MTNGMVGLVCRWRNFCAAIVFCLFSAQALAQTPVGSSWEFIRVEIVNMGSGSLGVAMNWNNATFQTGTVPAFEVSTTLFDVTGTRTTGRINFVGTLTVAVGLEFLISSFEFQHGITTADYEYTIVSAGTNTAIPISIASLRLEVFYPPSGRTDFALRVLRHKNAHGVEKRLDDLLELFRDRAGTLASHLANPASLSENAATLTTGTSQTAAERSSLSHLNSTFSGLASATFRNFASATGTASMGFGLIRTGLPAIGLTALGYTGIPSNATLNFDLRPEAGTVQGEWDLLGRFKRLMAWIHLFMELGLIIAFIVWCFWQVKKSLADVSKLQQSQGISTAIGAVALSTGLVYALVALALYAMAVAVPTFFLARGLSGADFSILSATHPSVQEPLIHGTDLVRGGAFGVTPNSQQPFTLWAALTMAYRYVEMVLPVTLAGLLALDGLALQALGFFRQFASALSVRLLIRG